MTCMVLKLKHKIWIENEINNAIIHVNTNEVFILNSDSSCNDKTAMQNGAIIWHTNYKIL